MPAASHSAAPLNGLSGFGGPPGPPGNNPEWSSDDSDGAGERYICRYVYRDGTTCLKNFGTRWARRRHQIAKHDRAPRSVQQAWVDKENKKGHNHTHLNHISAPVSSMPSTHQTSAPVRPAPLMHSHQPTEPAFLILNHQHAPPLPSVQQMIQPTLPASQPGTSSLSSSSELQSMHPSDMYPLGPLEQVEAGIDNEDAGMLPVRAATVSHAREPVQTATRIASGPGMDGSLIDPNLPDFSNMSEQAVQENNETEDHQD